MKTLIGIQEKQIAAELAAIRKHKNAVRRSVIFAARTRSLKAIMEIGFTREQAKAAVQDAADIVALQSNVAVNVFPMEVA